MFGFFKKKQPKTALDELNAATAAMFRPTLNNRTNTSDDKIVEIVQTVMRAYKEAADSKSEIIPASTLIDISRHFVAVYDLKGHDFFLDHLKYEIEIFLSSGLREKWGGQKEENLDGTDMIFDQACSHYEKGNLEEAVAGFKNAAEQGMAQAQFNLGVMYADGEGVRRNFDKAIKWLTKAAEQGIEEYQYNLGVIYSTADGSNQDFKEAARWMGMASDQGYADAQHMLGVMYMRGDGVEQNIQEAIAMLTKAAEQGHKEALNVLSRLADTISE